MKEHASSCCGSTAACSTLHHTRELRCLRLVLLVVAACRIWRPHSRRGRSRIFAVSMSNLLVLALKSLKVLFRVIIELVEVVLKNLWDSKLHHGEELRRGEDVWIRVKNLLIVVDLWSFQIPSNRRCFRFSTSHSWRFWTTSFRSCRSNALSKSRRLTTC